MSDDEEDGDWIDWTVIIALALADQLGEHVRRLWRRWRT